MTSIEIDLQEDAEVVVATVTGEIDMSNASVLSERLATPALNSVVGIVVDLSDVRYLDSAGMAELFDTTIAIAGRGQSMALVIPAESRLRRLFEISGVEKVAPISSTVEAARALILESAGP